VWVYVYVYVYGYYVLMCMYMSEFICIVWLEYVHVYVIACEIWFVYVSDCIGLYNYISYV